MSVYNSAEFIDQSISSILNQTYKDFEFLIIDDCSTDNSFLIIEKYSKRDNRIKIFQNSKNLGLTKNLNKLIYHARGNYIARMDADDISLPDRLKKQVNFLNENPNIDIVGCFSENISEKGQLLGTRNVPIEHQNIIRLLPKLNPMSHPTVMIRTSSLKKIGGYDQKYRTSQDFHLWYKAAGLGMKFHNIPEYLFQYRMNDDYTNRKSFQYRWNEFKIKLDGYKLINLPWYKYYNALISLALAFVPSFLFQLLKKFDPR